MKPSVQRVITEATNNAGPPVVVDRSSRVGRQGRVAQRYYASRVPDWTPGDRGPDGKLTPKPAERLTRARARELVRERSKTGGKHPHGQTTTRLSRAVGRARSRAVAA